MAFLSERDKASLKNISTRFQKALSVRFPGCNIEPWKDEGFVMLTLWSHGKAICCYAIDFSNDNAFMYEGDGTAHNVMFDNRNTEAAKSANRKGRLRSHKWMFDKVLEVFESKESHESGISAAQC